MAEHRRSAALAVAAEPVTFPTVTAVVVSRRHIGWEDDVRQHAYETWCWAGRQSGVATEFLLLKEAEAATPEGEEVPAVPSARTINDWARIDDWRRRFYRELAAGQFQEELIAARVQLWQIGRGAAETMARAQAGMFDHHPQLLAAKVKEAEFATRLAGSGTYGQQFGGSVEPQISDLLPPDDLAIEDETLTPQQLATRNRERMLSAKRGGG